MMYRGMGTTGTAVVGTVGAIGAEVAKDTAVFGAVEAGSLAVPIVGAAIASVTALVSIFMAKNALYHAQESATTKIVDQAEQYMKQNLDAWNRSSKTFVDQQAALQNFGNLWGEVIKACNQQQYGDPGRRCYQDRQEGSCHWTFTGQTPGVPPDCGNWFIWYRDPIANAVLQSDLATGSLIQSLHSNPLPALLVGGLLLAAVWG